MKRFEDTGNPVPPAWVSSNQRFERCTVCGDDQMQIDEEKGSPTEGLCVTCQPCPGCGLTGRDCDFSYCWTERRVLAT